MIPMGLTNQSSGFSLFYDETLKLPLSGDYTVALAGNPNVGKSTVFNALTGLRQHTGNWPGKTVTSARGLYSHRGKRIALVDLPGTYSLLPNSIEEKIARDFILFGQPDATVVVTDATCLERNLNLVLQVTEITSKVVVCLNLVDEAKRRKISIDSKKLAEQLGVPVVPTAAKNGMGLEELKNTINAVASGVLKVNPKPIVYSDELETQIARLASVLQHLLPTHINPRWAALRIIERDESVIENLRQLVCTANHLSEGAYSYGHVV